MNFFQAIGSGFRKYAVASGRASRSEFWYWMLFSFLLKIAVAYIDKISFGILKNLGPVGLTTFFVTALPSTMVAIRRLHDINRSGWWLLIVFVPLVNIVLLTYWYCKNGDAGANRFGARPTAETMAQETMSTTQRVAFAVCFSLSVLLGVLLAGKGGRHLVTAQIEKAAERGDAMAQFSLGRNYFRGNGVQKDYKKAAAWWRKAADQGLPNAQWILSIAYHNGWGVDQNEQEAMNWWRKAVDPENPKLQQDLSKPDYKTEDIGKVISVAKSIHSSASEDRDVAIDALTKLATEGDRQAQFSLGNAYHGGAGVAKDDKEAVRWWRQSAEQGMPAAQWALSVAYHNGWGVGKDDTEALNWWRKNAELWEEKSTNSPKTTAATPVPAQEIPVAEIKAAAPLPVPATPPVPVLAPPPPPPPPAMADPCAAPSPAAGTICADGTTFATLNLQTQSPPPPVDDKAQSLHPAEKNIIVPPAAQEPEAPKVQAEAVPQLPADAQVALGKAYYKGDGVKKNPEEAVLWWRRAAEQGDSTAQLYLGVAYFNGVGVAKDRNEGEKWLHHSAAQGNRDAQKMLVKYGLEK